MTVTSSAVRVTGPAALMAPFPPDLAAAALELAMAMYRRGRDDEAALHAATSARWNRAARTAITGEPRDEMSRRRWGPRGRRNFASPRPGDFPGLAKGAVTPAWFTMADFTSAG